MSKQEIQRRMEEVDESLGGVLEGSDAALAVVAKAVRDLNETLAVHAAWTDERFEAVDDRLVSLARIGVMTASKVEMQIAGIDARMLGFGVGQSGMGKTLSAMEQDHGVLLREHVARLHSVEQGQEALREGLAALVETVQGLMACVGEALAHAISVDVKQHVRPAGEMCDRAAADSLYVADGNRSTELGEQD